ncbi:hypothetical protein WICPIJ_003183 [Wickerhamomyces pijperi]|uniref:Uncharacterized protein n=1 Tax=Wickerhamomyces pijperi TaxID=599730 RepID=A0A9P8TNY3_WICPI|nr:hypothetical protein WICPIJ_003183 [Wickerhamomyces pijperi]
MFSNAARRSSVSQLHSLTKLANTDVIWEYGTFDIHHDTFLTCGNGEAQPSQLGVVAGINQRIVKQFVEQRGQDGIELYGVETVTGKFSSNWMAAFGTSNWSSCLYQNLKSSSLTNKIGDVSGVAGLAFVTLKSVGMNGFGLGKFSWSFIGKDLISADSFSELSKFNQPESTSSAHHHSRMSGKEKTWMAWLSFDSANFFNATEVLLGTKPKFNSTNHGDTVWILAKVAEPLTSPDVIRNQWSETDKRIYGLFSGRSEFDSVGYSPLEGDHGEALNFILVRYHSNVFEKSRLDYYSYFGHQKANQSQLHHSKSRP